jgi:alpha-mannosidase
MNNYWDTNYRASQGGSFRFRYVVTSAPSVNAPELSRIGWDEMTPLETDEVILQDRSMARARPLANNQASFLDVQGGNVLLETWKPAEDRNGTILRFLDLGGGTRTITVKTPLQHLQAAWLTDAVERNQQPLPLEGSQDFSFTLHRHQVATVRIVGEDIVKPPAL